MERIINFTRTQPEEWKKILTKAHELGIGTAPSPSPDNDTCVFMGPKMSGYNCLDIADLTEVEIESRRQMKKVVDFYRGCLPGFEKARVSQTAPQIGTRHSRRLIGLKKMVFEEWSMGKIHSDEIGVSPPPSSKYSNVSVPLSCLVPQKTENLIAAGRSLSCDARTHDFMREIPNCWLMGQAAGINAAIAVKTGADLRDVSISDVQKELICQGVYLQKKISPEQD